MQNITVQLSEPIQKARGQVWDTTYNGQTLVTGSRDPEFASCRVLEQMGLTGRVTFQHPNGMNGLTMGIAKGAKLRTSEPDGQSPIVRNWIPFQSMQGEAPEANNDDQAIILAKAA